MLLSTSCAGKKEKFPGAQPPSCSGGRSGVDLIFSFAPASRFERFHVPRGLPDAPWSSNFRFSWNSLGSFLRCFWTSLGCSWALLATRAFLPDVQDLLGKHPKLPGGAQSYLVPGPPLSYHGFCPPQGSASNSQNPSSLRMAGNLRVFPSRQRADLSNFGSLGGHQTHFRAQICDFCGTHFSYF